MNERLNACPEFDERVIESAMSLEPDATLDAHVATCERCQRARERYARTAETLTVAFVRPLPRTVRPRRRWPIVAAAAIAAGVLIAVVMQGVLSKSEFRVEAHDDAHVTFESDCLARVERGFASFNVHGAAATVRTPLGEVTSTDATFDVRVAEGDDVKTQMSNAVVIVAVTTGAVWWQSGEERVPVSAGESIERRAPGATTSVPSTSKPLAETAPDPTSAAVATSGFTVVGRVVDAETTAPVAGASVRAVAMGWGQAGAATSVVTDEDGRFQIERLSLAGDNAFRIDVEVVVKGYARSWSRVTSLPRTNATPPQFDFTKPVDAGELRLVHGARVSGRIVRGSDQRPIGGAAILYSDVIDRRFVLGDAHELGRSSDDGTFALAEPIAPTPDRDSRTLFAVSPDGIGWVPLFIGSGRDEVSNLEIVVARAAPLDVVVRDPDGRPVRGARICAGPTFEHLPNIHYPDFWVDVGGRDELASIFSAIAGNDGSARFDRLPPGMLILVAQAEGFASAREGLSIGIEEPESVSITLIPIATHSVTGRVVDVSGAPIAGATVSLQRRLNATTESDGRFRVDGVTDFDGSWWAEVSAPGFGKDTVGFKLSREPVVEIKDFVLGRLAPIEGRVVDQDGAPLSSVRLDLVRSSKQMNADSEATGSDGRFAFSNATEGEWTLRTQDRNPFSDPSEWIYSRCRVVRGGDRDVRVVLRRVAPGPIRFVADVVDPETDQPLDPSSACFVPAVLTEDGSPTRMPSNAKCLSGKVVVEHAFPGNWRLDVAVNGRPSVRVPVTISDGDTEAHLRVEVGRAGSLEGRVILGDIPRPPALCVSADDNYATTNLPGGQHSSGMTNVDEDGSFHFDVIRSGRVRVWITSYGVRGEAVAEIPPNGKGTVEIQAEQVGIVTFESATAPGCDARIDIAEGDGARHRASILNPSGPDEPMNDWVTVLPGRVQWRVRFPAEGNLENPRESAEPQEGEVTVGVGERVTVHVPIVPKPR